MKRLKSFAVLCAMLFLLLASISVTAEEIIYFTAINNTILNLEQKTMPIKYSSMIYVPFKVFNSSELGVYSIYSQSKQVVLLSDGAKSLYFDMLSGNSYDETGTEYRYSALYQNDTVYIPAYFTADFFDVKCSYIRSDSGHIVRLVSGNALSDKDFLSGALSIMASKLEQLQEERDSVPSPTPTPPTVKPTPVESSLPPLITPTPTPTPPSVVPTHEPVNRSHVCVYLAIGGLGNQTPTQLDCLEQYGYSACFFASTEEIYRYPDIVRRLVGEGYEIGLRYESDLDSEYGDFSAALFEAAHGLGFIVAADHLLTKEEAEQMEASSLKLWFSDKPVDNIEACDRMLSASENRCDLLLSQDFSIDSLKFLLLRLQTEHYTLKNITTTEEAWVDYAEIYDVQ